MNNKVMFMIAMIILILAVVNSGLALFDISLVSNYWKIMHILIVFAGVVVFFNRNTYLPFLGEGAFPCGSLEETHPEDFTDIIRIRVEPNQTVLYWGAEPSVSNDAPLLNYKEAYQNYKNYGVARSDINGYVLLRFRHPQSYQVPFGMKIEPHLHYRVCVGNGLMSEVKTIVL